MIYAIILAGGNSTRIGKTKVNKVVLDYKGKPLIVRALECLPKSIKAVYIVIGAYANSVRQVLKNYPVYYVRQDKRLGTAHGVKLALEKIKKESPLPDAILVGYGDHMMIYSQKTINNILEFDKNKNGVISFISTKVKDPTGLGRVIHNKNGQVINIIEEKDASEFEKKINIINAGLYCFKTNFLIDNINKVKINKTSGEYYLTDLVSIASKQNLKVYDMLVDYNLVGGGVNTKEQLEKLNL